MIEGSRKTRTTTSGKARRTEQPERVLLYLRISSDPDGREVGIDKQRADGRALCKRNGWTIVDEFKDNNKSASRYARKVRPDFSRMLETIDAGGASRIVAYNLDRLLRNPKELEALIDRSDAGMLTVTSLQGDLDLATEDGRFTARVLVAHSAKESDATSRRVRRGKANAREQGRTGGTVVSFGWYGKRHGTDPATGLEYVDNGERIHPGEAKIIRQMAKRYLAGESLTGVAVWLNNSGVRPAITARWSATTVRHVLTLPRNGGHLAHDGEIVKRHAWKAILNGDTYELLCAKVAANGNVSGPRRRVLLTGMVHCECGARLLRGNDKGRVVWRCRTGRLSQSCGRVSVGADLLERFVVERVLRYTDSPTFAAMLRRSGKTDDDDGGVSAELADIARRLDDLDAMFEAGTLSRARYERMNRKLLDRQTHAHSSLHVDTGSRALAPFSRRGALRQAWAKPDDEFTLDQRRAVLTALVDHVLVNRSAKAGRYQPPIDERAEVVFRIG
jgi:DNA invertase Pin-like site-specific DNA recombinase